MANAGYTPAVVSTIADELLFDVHKKLAHHYVVFPVNRPDCPTWLWESGRALPGYGYTPHPVDGDALVKVFPHYGMGKSHLSLEDDDDDDDDENDLDDYDGYNDMDENDDNDDDDVEDENHNFYDQKVVDERCMAACLEKGTDIRLAGHTMPNFHFVTDLGDRSGFHKWFREECGKVEVCFINYTVKERPLEVFWVNPRGGKRSHRQVVLNYGDSGTQCFHTYIGHEFEAIDEESEFYEKVTIQHTTTHAFGSWKPSSPEKFEAIHELEQNVRNALNHEWKKHQKVKRTFSSLGFAKGRLPDDVFATMGAFYYNNRHNAVAEEWNKTSIFVNSWESDVNFIAIPWELKRKWQTRLMELVNDWAGVELQETAMYGLRQYERGARLLSHVDRIKTHALSLIVNVAQDNLASPWPVEIFDHGDRLHEITMEAGDIVYYESAKNLHGRNRPLTCKPGGCRFVNLFAHYRPIDNGDTWHKNLSDQENRPPPLVEGDVDFDHYTTACRRLCNNSSGINDVTNNVQGVGTVRCNDKRLGSFLSPTLFRARKAEDLFRWWKATADPRLIGFDDNHEAVYGDVARDLPPPQQGDPTQIDPVDDVGDDGYDDDDEEDDNYTDVVDCYDDTSDERVEVKNKDFYGLCNSR
jgi:hypothetical protein